MLSKLLPTLLLSTCAFAQTAGVDIPYQKFVLDNGLTVIVHEDHKAPIVAVNIWYHVGSKNEKPGKTGFAHLFEHLMFGGSENFHGRYIDAMEEVGATDLNGTTNNDRTNYFEDVPTSALDYALFLESDRMGHLLGSFDEKTLNLQRGVVQNEKRQGENEPYGVTEQLITENTYPAGHPYSWTVIGSMDDLNAASMNDVKEWFKSHYGPSNAVLALAGDIDLKTAKEKAQKYFGDIPPGPPIAKQEVWVAKMTGTHRSTVEDRVPQARLYKVWNVPQYGAADTDYLTLVSRCLAQGKVSRLYKRLVYDDQIATDVRAYVDEREIGSQFEIEATARPGQDLAKVEKEVDEELARFLEGGPDPKELARVKTQYAAGFIRGVDRIGGFGGKSDVLARGQAYLGDAGFYKTQLQRVQDASVQDLKSAARRWLADGVYILDVYPFPSFKTDTESVDRSKMPVPGTPPELKLPQLERMTLSNGLKVILAARHEIPVVEFRLQVDAGYAADQFAAPGTASLTAALLDGGTAKRTALQISDEAASLGAQLRSYSDLDTSTVSLSALKSNLDPSLDLYADVILHPAFPETDFRRQQKQQIAAIEREKVTPVSMALRVFPGLLYGPQHAYGNPLTGSGTQASVAKLSREDLVKFHETWFKPNHATLIVVGDTTAGELKPKLESLFDGWKEGNVPVKNIAAVAYQPKPVVYLLDRPGSMQSTILAGEVAPPRNNPDEIGIEAMNDILGGTFGARINMNLREDKHWSYGARTLLWDARGQRPFIVFAPVETDKTKESLAEIDKELRGILGPKPPTPEELAKVKDTETLSLPGSRETMGEVANSIDNLVEYGLPDDYYEKYAGRVRALQVSDVEAMAKRVVRPDNLVWVVVGDRAKIEAGVRELNLGELKFLDADGKPM
ncbi:MAG TPA: pitrilysin family protein [Bryobacteraceae bacterium]|jgi:zinc protease|nr:pitrilysin family protein [Bryobacteraceae bacterium]